MLIILAVVSINVVLGENGLIQKAKTSKEVYEQAKVNEEAGLSTLEEKIDEYMPKPENTPTTPAGTEVVKPSGWASAKIKAISDGKGGTVPLPNGFYYVGGNYNDGLVISDKQGDEIDATGTSMGNQFVWIPVPNQEALTRTEFDNNGQPTTGLGAMFTEPFNYDGSTGYATEASEYNTMREQVIKYKGFYIGRYEAGINSTTLRTVTTTAQTVVSKKGVAPYNKVPWGTAMNDPSEISGQSGAVYLAKSMYSTSASVTSTLIYGCQWDAMCRYIGDANRKADTKSAPELTGSVSTDVSKNIYDLAGNCAEWTMEALRTGNRVLRGGAYDYSTPVSTRDYNSPTTFLDIYSFRCGLYIK